MNDDSRLNQVEVSIIVPIYNTANYVEGCLKSLTNQGLKNYEIICVDDGSTDNSVEIIRKYTEINSSVILLVSNHKGQGAARNEGLRLASGKYVYFMDSDDVLSPNSLSECVKIMSNKNVDLLLFDAKTEFETTDLKKEFWEYSSFYKRKQEYSVVRNGREMLCELYMNQDYFVSPCCYVISRKLLEQHLIYFPEGIVYEDNVFTMRLFLSAERVLHLKKEFFLRYVRNGSTSTKEKSVFNSYSYFACFIHIFKHFQSVSYDSKVKIVIEKICSEYIENARKIFLKSKNKADITAYLDNAPILWSFLFKRLVYNYDQSNFEERVNCKDKLWERCLIYGKRHGYIPLITKCYNELKKILKKFL